EEIEEEEVLAKILEDSRDPSILYKKEFESYDLTPETWKHIGNEILKGNTNQVAEQSCKPWNKIQYKLYRFSKKSTVDQDCTLEGRLFDRRRITWWKETGQFLSEKDSKEAYRQSESDDFKNALRKAYLDPPEYPETEYF